MSTLEAAILTAIGQLGDDAHGATIHQIVGGSIGAMYVALERLEDRGLVRSWLEPGGEERGWREKRCYALVGRDT